MLEAELHERDGRVVLRRECPDHGRFEAVVYGDAERYREIQRFDKPGAAPLLRQTEVAAGCPHDCGICPEHAQHTCLGIIEVNTACNLDCPICFADSGTGHRPTATRSPSSRSRRCSTRSSPPRASPRRSSSPAASHRSIPRSSTMLAAAKARGIPLVMLNTNGIRLARDPRFAPALAEIGVHVYLQFDGFDDATHLAIRGRDLPERSCGRWSAAPTAGVTVSLAAAIERGVNEHEVGAILRFGVEHPAVTGVFFQPVTHSGRYPAFDPLDKLTNPDVIRGVCGQLPDWFRADDFVAVPCCSPTCRSATFALYDGEDLVPLPRLVDVEQYLDYVTNRAVPDLEVRDGAARACGPPRPPAGPSRWPSGSTAWRAAPGCRPSCRRSRRAASWS